MTSARRSRRRDLVDLILYVAAVACLAVGLFLLVLRDDASRAWPVMAVAALCFALSAVRMTRKQLP
jgi:hypothetical protein